MMLGNAALAERPLANEHRGNEIAVDASGNGHHGIYTGDPNLGRASLVDNNANTSAQFPTTGELVYVGDADAFSFATNTFAIEFWFQPTYTIFYEGILGKRAVNWEYAVYRSGTDVEFRAFDSTGNIVYSTSYTITDLSKHHYVWTADGTNARLYVDTTLKTTVAKTANDMSNTTAPLILCMVGPVSIPGQALVNAMDNLKAGLTETSTLVETGVGQRTGSDSFGILAETATMEIIAGPIAYTASDTMTSTPTEASSLVITSPDVFPITASDDVGVTLIEPYVTEQQMDTVEEVVLTIEDTLNPDDDVTMGMTETATIVPTSP